MPERTEDERHHWTIGDRPELDPVRVAKAVDLNVVRMDDDHFKVHSSRNEYYVVLRPHYDCGCGDFVWRNEICKHLIAALLWDGDEEARNLANEMIVSE